jgi:hypothetical protein
LQRRRAIGCAAALLASLALATLPACAAEPRLHGAPLQMSIIDRESGQPLTLHHKDGRAYVAGQPASRYAIRLANRSAGRVLVVLSVDGVNVVSGETAGFGQTGYVLDPWSTNDITGWRKSDSAIAAFEFAALADSYAARTGRPDNVGVIGAAVFTERPRQVAIVPPPSPPIRADAARGAAEPAARAEAAKAAAPAAMAAPATDAAADAGASSLGRLGPGAERLGTAHGQREASYVGRTSFERLSSSPQQVVEIAYDSASNLVAAGVIPRPPAQAQAQARAFPDDDARGYVPDPPPR